MILKVHNMNLWGAVMGNILDKNLAVLEEIVRSTPHPVSPLALSERLGIKRATCSRILKMLLESGYIIRVSRQAGYMAGPRIVTLNNMAQFQSELLKKAIPAVDRLAEAVRDSVFISQVYGGFRYVLYHKNCNPEHVIHLNQMAYEDVYATASGVVEMAYVPLKEALKIYDSTRWGSNLRPEFRERKMVEASLAKIRAEGLYHSISGIQGIFAVPVFANGVYQAALGCSMPVARYTPEHILEVKGLIQMAAEELSAALSVINSIG